MNVLRAFNDNERRDLRLVATLGSYMANLAGFGREKPVKPSDLIPQAFGKRSGLPSQEWLDEQYRRHEERLARERNRKSNGNARGTQG